MRNFAADEGFDTVLPLRNFAHQARNVLTAVLGNVELTQRRLRRDPVIRDETFATLEIAASKLRQLDHLITTLEDGCLDVSLDDA